MHQARYVNNNNNRTRLKALPTIHSHLQLHIRNKTSTVLNHTQMKHLEISSPKCTNFLFVSKVSIPPSNEAKWGINSFG